MSCGSQLNANLISLIHPDKNQSKWAKHYWKLCNRALNRELPKKIFVEQHHMFPKCVFGDNTLIVQLTPEEHYVAHQLLIKMYPDNPGLIYAAKMMTTNRRGHRGGNKLYGWLKGKASEAMKGKEVSIETRLKMSAIRTGRSWGKHTEDHKERMSLKRRSVDNPFYGKTHSSESRKKMSEARSGEKNHNYGKTPSNETRAKISGTLKGRERPEEVRVKISESNKGKPKAKVTCPYCGKQGGSGVMQRWHFDKCKMKR